MIHRAVWFVLRGMKMDKIDIVDAMNFDRPW